MNAGDQNQPKPIGEILKETLANRGWSQADLAEVMGHSRFTVHSLANGRKALDAEMALALGTALGTDAAYWLEVDSRYRLANAQVKVSNVARRAKMFNKAPVKEMVRRGWIEDSKDMPVLEQNLLRFFDINTLDDNPHPVPHAARKSTDHASISGPQLAWLFRARHLSAMVEAKAYTPNRFQQALDELKTLLEHPADIRRVPSILADGGVRLLVVQPLSKSKIDGACFWLDPKSPVVVLAMRYDRIDYFWHTLWHELGHVHQRDGFALDHDILPQESAEEVGARPESELLADAFAVENLVPQDNLNDFILRVSPLFSKNRLVGFAKLRGVHPGIVVGQLQHKGEISYTNHRNLLVKVRDAITASALTDGFGQMLPADVA